MIYSQAGTAMRKVLIIIFTIAALLAAAVLLLPKGFSDDLSKIGQGSVVVVLTHDKNSVGSMEVMVLLNNIRGDYTGKVDFLAVDVDTRAGQIFARQQDVGRVVLVVFAPDGTRQAILGGGIDETNLRLTLDAMLSS